MPPVNLLKLSKVNMALSKVLPSFKHGYKHATSTLQARYKHATSTLQARHKHAYRSTQACDKQAASAPQAGHKRVSRSKFNETLVIFFMCVAAQECTEGALDADDEAQQPPRGHLLNGCLIELQKQDCTWLQSLHLIKQHAHVNRSQVHLRVAHIPTFCKCDPREIEVEGGTVEVEGGADFVQPIEAGIN